MDSAATGSARDVRRSTTSATPDMMTALPSSWSSTSRPLPGDRSGPLHVPPRCRCWKRAGARGRVVGSLLPAVARNGPGATAAQIAREVDRIWARNADRIASGDADVLRPGEALRL